MIDFVWYYSDLFESNYWYLIGGFAVIEAVMFLVRWLGGWVGKKGEGLGEPPWYLRYGWGVLFVSLAVLPLMSEYEDRGTGRLIYTIEHSNDAEDVGVIFDVLMKRRGLGREQFSKIQEEVLIGVAVEMYGFSKRKDRIRYWNGLFASGLVEKFGELSVAQRKVMFESDVRYNFGVSDSGFGVWYSKFKVMIEAGLNKEQLEVLLVLAIEGHEEIIGDGIGVDGRELGVWWMSTMKLLIDAGLSEAERDSVLWYGFDVVKKWGVDEMSELEKMLYRMRLEQAEKFDRIDFWEEVLLPLAKRDLSGRNMQKLVELICVGVEEDDLDYGRYLLGPIMKVLDKEMMGDFEVGRFVGVVEAGMKFDGQGERAGLYRRLFEGLRDGGYLSEEEESRLSEFF